MVLISYNALVSYRDKHITIGRESPLKNTQFLLKQNYTQSLCLKKTIWSKNTVLFYDKNMLSRECRTQSTGNTSIVLSCLLHIYLEKFKNMENIKTFDFFPTPTFWCVDKQSSEATDSTFHLVLMDLFHISLSLLLFVLKFPFLAVSWILLKLWE